MIDSKALLEDLRGQVRLLEVDLAEQSTAVPGLADVLREEHAAERKARRTAAEWPAWRDARLTQVAVAWVLGTVFLRWSEDNGLIDPVLSGPGERLAVAEDAQLGHYRRHPEHHDGEWLAEQFEVLRSTDAGRLLFDPDHNPMYWVPISHDAAKNLVAFWRSTDGRTLRHDLTDPGWDTRFLGDLYQDLSEDAKKRYALLQTPRFVERFILDRTLTPAIDEFGLDGLRLVDPACGSGHFLLGAFSRLVEAWREQSPGLDGYEIVRRALGSVHGVDTNPFAVAIARFRLLVAALKAAGVTTFAQAAGQGWRPVVGCTDSLRTPERQESIAEVDAAVGYRARWEDVEEFADERLLASDSYHAVVCNPPYITMKDPEQNEYYRKRWSACHRQFQLTVPFAQRIFDLARRAGEDGLGAGYTGQITSNAFMKREFGTKLVEEFFPTVELTHVVDTSGAYIPGHGTPTVILIGRRAKPDRRETVRAVLGVRGEPSQPADPEKGLVWTAIEAQVDHPGSESDWVSVVDLPRSRLASHPWSLSGGGAVELLQHLESVSPTRIKTVCELIGFLALTREDDAYVLDRATVSRLELTDTAHQFAIGAEIRDWAHETDLYAVFPYSANGERGRLTSAAFHLLWPNRVLLLKRRALSGYHIDRGLDWFVYSDFHPPRWQASRLIAFAEVTTHNHFVLDRGGKVFKQTAPVIKLPAEASEDDHLALLGVLNSSTACFWLKQVCTQKGGGGVGCGFKTERWEERFAFNGSNVEEFPLPADLPLNRGRQLDSLARQLAATTPDAIAATATPTRDRLAAARIQHERLRAEMVAAQEELDWDVYRRYGLLSDTEAAEVLGDGAAEPLNLGERAFEIVLARRVAAGQADTQWFARHGSTPVTELPTHWPAEYRRTVEARIALIERRRDLALIERPECKRRWATESWERQQERALRSWLLDRLESRALWFTPDMNGEEQPAPQTVRTLADRLRGDQDFGSVAALWAGGALGRPDADLAEIVGELIDAEHVPFLAAYRYKPKGLAKRAEWEHTWALQRREDAIAARLGHDDVTHPEVRAAIATEIGEVPVPPKYGSGDFLRGSYWSRRGKLDVPKERFVSYPGAGRDGDGSLLLGWAGWDHREQAQALAVLVSQRRGDDGWPAERITPLLAGLAEVLPWVRQWHAEIDPVYGAAPADIYDGFLDAQLGELHLSRDQLAAWRPAGRVDVAPMPRRAASRGPRGGESGAPRARRSRSAPDPEHVDAVLTAAATGPLSNEQIRDLTGLDAAGARAVATYLVKQGRLVTTGQRRGMRYGSCRTRSEGDG
ncbi:BREX-2 system adenine-specific DNA-methyltransferase PglX [Pseudonocardia asaccharolytica]|uniref:site-specific DNA-methyltransferase (adenine-specific) n=1 Tax=Pseudonocardia asaccharolytica DSM 44247 = NBRC 16224 TaxID=1123024 RepID=A0A511CYG8_9PSEU|nr:BREX-2 system adenine-specific DNA-methyltransferase PglX [Pseudonocardia asaccharolytica]GEL17293.1 DNA methylase [Pseudonocardia asaccharolytica DSM 44247 = NBRC 16224]